MLSFVRVIVENVCVCVCVVVVICPSDCMNDSTRNSTVCVCECV